MGGKKNKNKNKYSHKNNSGGNHNHHVQLTEQQQAALMTECLQINQLLQKNNQQLKQEKKCHLLSKKWLNDWKKYVAFQQITKGKLQEGVFPKTMGNKHPGQINQNMKKTVKDYYQIPVQMEDYTYLNIVLNDKMDKNQDYIAAGPKLWQALISRYEFIEDIIRPVCKSKGSYFYDSQLLSLDMIFVNHNAINEVLQKRDKFTKNDKNVLFDSKKMQISSIWQITDLYQFLRKYVNYVFNPQEQMKNKIKIWLPYNYLSFGQIQNDLAEETSNDGYSIYARHLDQKDQKFESLDTDQFLKSQYTLIIQINGEFLKSAKPQQKIRGYCEQCVKVKDLPIKCQCQEVFYCSMQCRIDDQKFHYNTCQDTFKSQDDQQYLNKKISLKQDFFSSGLVNLGNTCYMNSSLQYFLTITEVRQFFSNNNYLTETKQDNQDDTRFLNKFSKFCKQICQANKALDPWSIKGQISYNLTPFAGYKQHDANDFLTHFIELLSECLKQHENQRFHPIFKKNLVGQFDSTITCPQCTIQINNVEPFTQIILPIKPRGKKQFYNYAIIRKDEIIKGKAEIYQTWEQIRSNLGVGNKLAPIYCGKEGQQLKTINLENSPEKQIKSLKNKQLLIYPQFLINQGQQQFSFIQITTKNICGNQAKASIGYPFLIKIDPRINTMIDFWIQIAKNFGDKQLVEVLFGIDKQYRLQKLKRDQQQQKTKQNQQQTKQQELKKQDSKDKDQVKKEQYQQQTIKRFQDALKQANIYVFIQDTNKQRGKCYFCQKKCNNCPLPIILNQSIQEYFHNKLEQVYFEIQLKNKTQKETVVKNLANSGDSTIQDCFQLFKQPEQLDQQNAWYCSSCDWMRLAYKKLSIKSLPKYLILQLSRFKSEGDKKIKNNDPIEYSQIQTFEGVQYRLLSVIIHEGSMEAGHYWAICLRGNKYYIYNDDKVHETEKVFQKGAYILLYQKVQ